MPVLNEIATRLASDGVGTVGGTSGDVIHIGTMPETDTTGTVIALYEYGGEAADLGFGVTSKVKYEYPRVQVVCRGTANDYATPRATADTVRNKLAQVQGVTLSGINYLLVRPLQSPFPMKRDEQHRFYFACNYAVEKEPS
jgi:hypothetical protein